MQLSSKSSFHKVIVISRYLYNRNLEMRFSCSRSKISKLPTLYIHIADSKALNGM